jgi:hypothetical protein
MFLIIQIKITELELLPAKAAELLLHGLKAAGEYTHLILAMKSFLLAVAQKLR